MTAKNSGNKKMKVIFILFLISAFSAFTGFALPIWDEIRAECGSARMVWCQDAGEGSDAGAQGNALRLMGFDTDDGRGERGILTNLSNYAKPMLTPDGNRIIFSNRQEQKIYAVGFAGSNLKALAPGFALAVWRDSLTGTDWVYAGTITNQADSVILNIRRLRLDKPELSEPVWSRTPLNLDNFQLSADGRYASGLFPWPACGVAMLPDREWKKYGDGCWPSLSPDNNLLLWIFDGAHRNLTFFRTKTDERWIVNINNAPGLDGFEVYHPRWSNHQLFMVMTGPYKLGEGNNRIRGGGKEVEIYLGKFTPDFRKIERWIQVTHNQSADFFPDLWIAEGKAGLLASAKLPGEAGPVRPSDDLKSGATTPPAWQAGCLSSSEWVRALPAGKGLQEKEKASFSAWPVSYEGLVFFWQNRSKANTFTDPVSGLSHVCRAEARGRARYGRHFEMDPHGGAFIAAGGAGELINACTASGQLAVEAVILPDTNSAGQLFPIIGYTAESGSCNFLLGQQGRELVFRLRAAKGGADYVIPLGALPVNEPSHVIISCSSSSVAYYRNGEQVFSKDSVSGGNWTSASSSRPELGAKAAEPQDGKIVFGNEWQKEYAVNIENDKTGWGGLLENVALYSRWIGPEEVREKYKASIEKIIGRKQLPVLSVKAKLVSMPAIPSPESIAPYRRALAVGHYRIEQVVEGTCSNQEVMVAQWVILDGQRFFPAQCRQGKTYQLRLEPFSDHPELEGERLIMDSDRFDLPMYYDIEGK